MWVFYAMYETGFIIMRLDLKLPMPVSKYVIIDLQTARFPRLYNKPVSHYNGIRAFSTKGVGFSIRQKIYQANIPIDSRY